MARVERLINLIAALLEAPRPMTAEQIRTVVAGYGNEPSDDAFRRAFERDKEALREMGVPLETVPTDPFADQADGYVIPKERYYLPEISLAPEEIAALRLAAESVVGPQEDAAAGVIKVALDRPWDPSPGPRVAISTDVSTEQPVLGRLYEAVNGRRAVSFRYRPAEGEPAVRTVEGYGLVHRRGHWYLVGRDVDRDAIRSFKVARIESRVEILDRAYERPRGFDASGHLGTEAWEIGSETVRATVRFDADLRWWAEQNMRAEGRTENPDGSVDVELEVANLPALVSWALGFGGAVEILQPDEARAAMVAHLDAVRTALR